MKRTLPPAGQTASERVGFTLIEVLCALALSSLLLSAVYGAVHMQWKFRNAGESHIEQAQILQGVIDDLASDFRAIPAPRISAEQKPVERAVFNGVGFVPMTEIRERLLNLNVQTKREAVEFFGSEHFIVMQLAHPSPRFSGLKTSLDEETRSAQQQVVWLSPDARELSVPFVRENDVLRFRSLRLVEALPGVRRLCVSSTELMRGASTSSLDVTPENSQVIAAEIRSVRFRFFDGLQWQTEWDSFVRQRLPHAVEVTLLSSFETAARAVVVRLPQSG